VPEKVCDNRTEPWDWSSDGQHLLYRTGLPRKIGMIGSTAGGHIVLQHPQYNLQVPRFPPMTDRSHSRRGNQVQRVTRTFCSSLPFEGKPRFPSSSGRSCPTARAPSMPPLGGRLMEIFSISCPSGMLPTAYGRSDWTRRSGRRASRSRCSPSTIHKPVHGTVAARCRRHIDGQGRGEREYLDGGGEMKKPRRADFAGADHATLPDAAPTPSGCVRSPSEA
jgi:hypothetical protein